MTSAIIMFLASLAAHYLLGRVAAITTLPAWFRAWCNTYGYSIEQALPGQRDAAITELRADVSAIRAQIEGTMITKYLVPAGKSVAVGETLAIASHDHEDTQSEADTHGAPAKSVIKTAPVLTIPFLLIVLTIAGCGSPCKTLKSAIDYSEKGQKIADAICECISFDATAAEICKAESVAFAFTDAQAKAAYTQFCSDAPKASPRTPLKTREDFDGWFAANGAVKS